MTPVTSSKGISSGASVCSDFSRAWENRHRIGSNDAPQLLHLPESDAVANHRENVSRVIVTTVDRSQSAAIPEIDALSAE
jgi:hypothetical protein